VNNLPNVVTQLCPEQELNPRPVDGKSNALPVAPPRHPVTLKPRPYQQQCPSNIVECYKFNDSFDNVEYCFDKVERSFDNVACCFDIVAGVDGDLNVRKYLFCHRVVRYWDSLPA